MFYKNMQIRNINKVNIFDYSKNFKSNNFISCSDVFSLQQKPNLSNVKRVSFAGLFSKKINTEVNDKIHSVSSGEVYILKVGDSVALTKDLFKVFSEQGFNCDLNSRHLKEKINNMQDGDELFIKKKGHSDKEFYIYKNKDGLYLKNISEKNLTLFSDSCYKDYSEESLLNNFSSENLNFYTLISKKYNSIRRAQYDEKETFPCGRKVVEDVSSLKKPNYAVLNADGWYYRIPTLKCLLKKTAQTKPQRISLNVTANPKLIEELDEFFVTGKYEDINKKKHKINKTKLIGISYKLPFKSDSWLRRHDPITIYKENSFSSDVIEGIACISEKYKRASVNNVPLVGALIDKPWIALEDDYTEEDFLKIKQKAEKYNPALAEAMCQHAYQKWNCNSGYSEFSVSTGLMNSFRFLLDEYIEYSKNYKN